MLKNKAERITAGKQYGGTRLNLKIVNTCQNLSILEDLASLVHHIAYQQNVRDNRLV